MTRDESEKINSDREIISLRMEAENLINNGDSLDETVFASESARIKNAIEQRRQYLIENLERRKSQE